MSAMASLLFYVRIDWPGTTDQPGNPAPVAGFSYAPFWPRASGHQKAERTTANRNNGRPTRARKRLLQRSTNVSKQAPAVLSQNFPQRSTKLPREDCCTHWKSHRSLCQACPGSDNRCLVRQFHPVAGISSCPESLSRYGSHPHAPAYDASCTATSGYPVTSRHFLTSARRGDIAGSGDDGNPGSGRCCCPVHGPHARWPWE